MLAGALGLCFFAGGAVLFMLAEERVLEAQNVELEVERPFEVVPPKRVLHVNGPPTDSFRGALSNLYTLVDTDFGSQKTFGAT